MEAGSSTQSPDTGRDGMHVTLKLSSARKPISLYAQRRISFTRDAPRVPIGRASKVTSKGFVASDSNAYFESPVMSRHHAELEANFEDKTISIKDNGSLHGTFHTAHDSLSERQLIPAEPVKLADRDVLRFGVDIFRETVTFPPTILTVEIEDEPAKNANRGGPTNIFTVPDDPDSDDDMSDDESVVETSGLFGPTAQDLMMLEQHIIDLTADPEQTLLRDVYDITGSPNEGLSATGIVDPAEAGVDVVTDDESPYSCDNDSDCEADSDSGHGSDCDSDCVSNCGNDQASMDDAFPVDQSDDEEDLFNEIEEALLSEFGEAPDAEEQDEEDDGMSVASNASSDHSHVDETGEQAPELPPRCKSPSDFIFQASTDTVAADEIDLSCSSQAITGPQTEPTCESVLDLDPADAPADSAWEYSGTSFINNPESIPLLSNADGQSQPVHVDETSAYTFEQSKADQTIKRLLISDLLAHEPQSEEEVPLIKSFESTSTKRSFETAFPADEGEHNTTTPCDAPGSTEHHAPLELVHTTKAPTRPQASLPKRRRIAEVAACVALGGAGVLSMLIYTAPSFA
ncbi:hypothetical protein Micbo1qcDRAFT_167274 [Microdochium bolleyi]|uniref:FHA domain-containing protein n=1 Tax=Microdochium bolleyi TaxID=196109 RepID=A0A136IRW5_9PEZI|nr:hypothetical protein Micbo1qcDRAFT_167274 [Microdochium bolleyi]